MPEPIELILRDVMQPPSLQNLVLLFMGAGLAFGLLERLFPATRRNFLRPGMAIDVFYWLFTPIVTKVITSALLVMIAFTTLTLFGWPITPDAMNGYGPIARQPIWLQLLETLVIADLIGYWTHRVFHVTRLWRIHAVHHSPRCLDWLSAYRVHPLNDAISRMVQATPMFLIGFSPRLMISYVPFVVIYVVFLHSNIRWTFGPLKYVLASPTFHRWHHSSEQEGIDRNYATIFPFWDLLFGTYYMPDRQPERYGVKDNSVPEDVIGQMLHPFSMNAAPQAADPDYPAQ